MGIQLFPLLQTNWCNLDKLHTWLHCGSLVEGTGLEIATDETLNPMASLSFPVRAICPMLLEISCRFLKSSWSVE